MRTAHRHRHVPGGCQHKREPDLELDLRRIEAIARDRFRLGRAIPVRVEELVTSEPGFPPVETRVLFWTGNAAQHQHRVFKPARDVTIEDLPPWWYKDALILDEFPYCDCCG